jgi:hypothetical protein
MTCVAPLLRGLLTSRTSLNCRLEAMPLNALSLLTPTTGELLLGIFVTVDKLPSRN